MDTWLGRAPPSHNERAIWKGSLSTRSGTRDVPTKLPWTHENPRYPWTRTGMIRSSLRMKKKLSMSMKSRKVPHGSRWWDKSLLFIRDYYFITNYIWNLGFLYGMTPYITSRDLLLVSRYLWGSRGWQPMSHLPPPCEAYRHRRIRSACLVGWFTERGRREGKGVKDESCFKVWWMLHEEYVTVGDYM